jgi:hypothetical protein
MMPRYRGNAYAPKGFACSSGCCFATLWLSARMSNEENGRARKRVIGRNARKIKGFWLF